jgi:tagaturonate epimerase
VVTPAVGTPLRPRPIGTASSFGFGDRTGRATPGHVRAITATGTGFVPVLAQQSARELERTGRTFAEVLDAAARGAHEAGWTGDFGADADHLRTTDEVQAALEAGFTMLTLDPSAHVDESGGGVETLPWAALEDDWKAMRKRHADDPATASAAATFGAAIAHVATLARIADGADVDIEVSVDETSRPTTPFEHRFLATELRRLGVPFTSLAPRFAGRWQKALDVAGDLDEIRRSVEAHADVAAEHGGYKLSVHSGSDKFSVYPILAEATDKVHVKTSGTSYLEALRVVADAEPDLFRAILDVARRRFDVDRASYELSPDAEIPAAAADLPALIDEPRSRQALHVTYGAVLAHPEIGPAFLAALDAHAGAYAGALERHLGRHLAELG